MFEDENSKEEIGCEIRLNGNGKYILMGLSALIHELNNQIPEIDIGAAVEMGINMDRCITDDEENKKNKDSEDPMLKILKMILDL